MRFHRPVKQLVKECKEKSSLGEDNEDWIADRGSRSCSSASATAAVALREAARGNCRQGCRGSAVLRCVQHHWPIIEAVAPAVSNPWHRRAWGWSHPCVQQMMESETLEMAHERAKSSYRGSCVGPESQKQMLLKGSTGESDNVRVTSASCAKSAAVCTRR